jgi:hypothetical protein
MIKLLRAVANQARAAASLMKYRECPEERRFGVKDLRIHCYSNSVFRMSIVIVLLQR